jgi:hypothetical protein
MQKKWNEICMKELAGGKYMENKFFLRTLKFKMSLLRLIFSPLKKIKKFIKSNDLLQLQA